MGPRSTRSAAASSVIVATPGRLLDHFRVPYAKLRGLEYLVLDEADRMLDMGFLPDIKRILKHIPTRAADAVLQRDHAAADRGADARDAARPRDDQPGAPGRTRGRHHAGDLPGDAATRRAALLVTLLESGEIQDALVFTRTKHRADRLARRFCRSTGSRPSASTATARSRSAPPRSPASRAASTACWSRPTSRRAASTSRRSATS